jgi:predicted enzyme related to lactoylglutathione lyase
VTNSIGFFTVHADNVRRARRFYEKVFGWEFREFGPPDFSLISTGIKGQPGIRGALHERHELVPGIKTICFECAITVADVDATAAAVQAHGGKLIMPKCEILSLGELIKFQDPEGNVVDAMRFTNP